MWHNTGFNIDHQSAERRETWRPRESDNISYKCKLIILQYTKTWFIGEFRIVLHYVQGFLLGRFWLLCGLVPPSTQLQTFLPAQFSVFAQIFCQLCLFWYDVCEFMASWLDWIVQASFYTSVLWNFPCIE